MLVKEMNVHEGWESYNLVIKEKFGNLGERSLLLPRRELDERIDTNLYHFIVNMKRQPTKG